ncbi:glycosyltransferase family 2 protein [Solidesulfovibrio sp.]|uniref:glycosyltransferase family 2 protein n=1 Tax=Solidesulfovibrio sp. TaxID=2910990 RepID=UPI002B206D50|nr:glycosyltransferase family 2 protein [Solidesulfovibrio sp.]MEA5088425.1 glycosyltransferase family 2 protein [Solidesulfovibrio sp.]
MLTNKKISVVVACYRDEGSIPELLRRLEETMARITPSFEVIYVNDASPDRSGEVLLEMAKERPWLTVVSHSRNFGAQVAFTSGMYQAEGDAVVIMDGDLQDPPELIERFVSLWLEGNDVVYGIRAKRNEGMVRNLGYKAFYRILQKISYLHIPLDAGEFSLMDRVVVDSVLACPERDRLIRGLRAYAGFRQTGVEFNRPRRYWGESTQSLLDYIVWAYKSFTSFSLFPLRLISIVSFVMFFLLAFLFVFYLVAFMLGYPAPSGFMTLLGVLLMLGAIILFALGIIGEYLARLFIEVKNRPQPIINRLVNDQRARPRDWLGRAAPRD